MCPPRSSRHALARVALFLLFVACTASSARAAARPHVLVISIDGMRPDYVTHADEHHLLIPTLRLFMRTGTYAEGVIGVVPTLTYPSHITLVTGVWPREHGIYNNEKFDPLGTLHGAKFTDADAIRVETLWQAAKMAGYTTASVGWPITTSSQWIDYLMPANAEFEGSPHVKKQAQPADTDIHYDRPAGLREQLDRDIPNIPQLTVDEHRFAWTLAILRRFHPEFMTTHLGELDHEEHLTGPFSEESNSALEMLDGEVQQLVDIERSIDPNVYIVVVSDHGFAPVEKTLNLNVLFREAGLLPEPGRTDPNAWTAAPWIADGTAAVMLRDPSDKAAEAKVRALLDKAKTNPDLGIARVLTHQELVARGGFPQASFLVELRPGFKFGVSRTGDLIVPSPHTGTHGFLPDRPELRASFLMIGPDVAAGRDLGVIDMRQVAPTVAKILGTKLPAAKVPPVHYEESVSVADGLSISRQK